MKSSALQFYDQLAEDYHLIYQDWDQAIHRQSRALDNIIQDRFDAAPGLLSVLDCSCGIGTQSIGLALLGYRVHGTDLSTKAVERARREANRSGVVLTFDVAEICELEDRIEGLFDVVIACDNSLPHLLNDKDLLQAARVIRSKLKPNGLLIASIHDYDSIFERKPRTMPIRLFDDSGGRRIIFQIWDWNSDGHTYKFQHFVIKEDGEGWQTTCRRAEYRALLRGELSEILFQAGFSGVRWLLPETSGYFQPVVTAFKR